MAKKTWVIVSLVLSVISLAYILLDHYGLIRYMKLKSSPLEKYIEGYTELPMADEKARVVISFTTNDYNNLTPFINSLLDQTVRVDDIALTVPYKDMGKVPKELKKVVNVYGISKDYDDANKLIPTVLREASANTKILIVEPHMIYGKEFVADMIDASEDIQNVVLYGKGKSTEYGVLVNTDFFDEQIVEYKKGDGCCNWIKRFKNVTKDVGCSKTYRYK